MEWTKEQLEFLGVESIDDAKSSLEELRAARQKDEDEQHSQFTSEFSEKQRDVLSQWFGDSKRDQLNALKLLRELGLTKPAEKKQTVVPFSAPKSASVSQIDHAAKHAELKKVNPIQAAAYFAAHSREIMLQKGHAK